MVALDHSVKIFATRVAVLIFVVLLGASAAKSAEMQYQDLPSATKTYVEGVRDRCKEFAPDAVPKNQMAGISLVDLGDGTPGLIIDSKALCKEHYTEANCSNRGCDLQIMAKTDQSWKEVFNEHLYRRIIDIGSARKLNSITAAIYAGDRHCSPPRGNAPMRGETCNVRIRYHDKSWDWKKIN
jgi:hypothetical protein